ncbi:ABC transporter ATP-binding protein [Paenibacillus chungangensis]|uniref:ABC transporter ATP-binding protein n=1 Tax=Paenibacillus chungangensis TaxID=696535 RepID=A0ABW3HRC8_9BACL
MDIHAERQLKQVNDKQLWGKMLQFAIPYWKSIALSFLFAWLIAVATVTQPLIVKMAIDDRINGVYKPMVAIAGEVGNQTDLPSSVQGKSVQLGGMTYYRVKGEGDIRTADAAAAQIIAYEGQHYLLDGWVDNKKQLVIQSDGEGGAITAQSEADIWQGKRLSKNEVDAFRKQDVPGFITIALLFLLNVVVAGLFTYWQSNLLQMTGQRIIHDIRMAMFRHLTNLQTSFYDRNPVGRLVTRVAHDVEAVNQLCSQVIVNMAKEILLLLGIAAVMIYLDIELALLSFAVIPVMVVATYFFKGVIREAQRSARAKLSRLNSFLAESLSGMVVVQMFTREKKQLEEFKKLNNDHYLAVMKAMTSNSIFNPMIGFFGNLALALVVWYGGGSVMAAGVTFGVVYAFTAYVRQFFQPLMSLADRYTQIQTALASAERIFELLDEKPLIRNSESAVNLPKPLQGAISFDRVWFAYEEKEWVLQDISFDIMPGETIAFVGATGAGKSSIIGLINRFYDVQKGSLQLDGHELREIDLEQLRTSVGIIQQDPFIFTGNVYDNIRMNRSGISDEAIRRAAEELDMESFIARLPEGFQTKLGEQGIGLSSGQQQLIAFLRVYISNPDILVLDEATAHVDTETEMALQRGLLRISQGRTTLIVAHRLSTIRHADRIIVMHKGRIQEMGNHEALMNRRGIYRKLYELQSGERPSERQDQQMHTSHA